MTLLLLISLITFQAQAATAPRIGGFDVRGAKRLNAEQVVSLSKLTVGQPFDSAALRGAIDRLVATGVFANVRCSFEAGRVVFEIEEHPWNVPVSFDNFLWWTDAELIKAIAEVLPTFDGMAPPTDQVLKVITARLDQLLQEKHLAGHAAYLPETSLGATATARNIKRYRFQVTGMSFLVCAIHFPNASGIPEAALQATMKRLVGAEYWRETVNSVVKETVMPMYLQRGFVNAKVTSPIAARFVATDACPSGVDVTIAIEEGRSYKWAGVTWSGNTVIASKKLDAAIVLKRGVPIDSTKVDVGINDAAVMYVRAGYFDSKLSIQKDFDEAKGEASYKIAVTEGPLYKMGTVTFAGASPDMIQQLQQLWQLKVGKPYDATYVRGFVKTAPGALARGRGGRPGPMSFTEAKNPNGPAVDVVVTVR